MTNKEDKVINVKELYENNIFMQNVRDIEKTCQEHDVDVLTGMSIWAHKTKPDLDPKEYSLQVKEFKEACIFVGYDFKVFYSALGI